MFKIKSDYDEHWIITLESTGEEVAEIDTSHAWTANSRTKQLKVKDRTVSGIKNQKEALEKLEKFFEDNKEETQKHKAIVEELTEDTLFVKSEHSIRVIEAEIKKVSTHIKWLEQYNLI